MVQDERIDELEERTEELARRLARLERHLTPRVPVATQVYDLVPAVAGVLLAAAVGATATVLAVRWRAQGIGALGIVGALLAPVLAGAPSSASTLALLWVAAAAASAVVIWQRWPWLSAASLVLTGVQWAAYL